MGLSDTPMLSSIFLADARRRSCSLKLGLLGPMSPAARREGRVRGSLWTEGSWDAPVSFWTTARKFDGSAWTKVVLGGIVGSDPKVVVVLEEAMRIYERESVGAGREEWNVCLYVQTL